jgi:hypothetical protein
MIPPLNMVDTASLAEGSSQLFSAIGTTPLMAFADQGQNLAGIFFQTSLLPYLVFLYFLGFRGNRTPAMGNFGFQFLLLFVLATIPSGIVTKAIYGCSLADVDWLHGGAEALLTTTNILIALGFKEAATRATPPNFKLGRVLALSAAGLFFGSLALGPGLGFEAHSPFLFGLGDLSPDSTLALPWVSFAPASLLRCCVAT